MAGEQGNAILRRLGRIWRHRLASTRQVRRTFDVQAFERIEDAIAEGETLHRGEVRFAVEAELGLSSLWSDTTPRERALQVFSAQGIWDTEENTGVLIYLLWADHAVEIIADRVASRTLPAAQWQEICARVAEACREGHHLDGVLAAVRSVNQALAAGLPARAREHDQDELPNRPILL